MQIASLYRGWWVLAGLVLIYAATNGILLHTLPLLYPSLIDEFGWDEVQVTLPATMFFVVAAITSPPAGVLLDRYSARKIILAGVIGIALGLAAYSHVDGLWQLVAVYIVFAVSLSMSGLVSNMLILTRWFSRLRGRATGILLMASSLGGAVFPLLLGASMEAFGWRNSLLLFAAVAAVMTILPLVVMVRDRPSDLGLVVDGGGDDTQATAKPPDGTGPTLREALRQPRFYVLALATGAVWFSIISLVQHQSIYLGRDVGIDRSILPGLFSTFFACSVIGKFAFGWLGDRIDKSVTMCLSVGIFIVGLVVLRSADPTAVGSLTAYAVIAGIGFSGAFTSIQLLIASYYAGASYGKILACLTLIDTLAGALGTRVVGTIRDSAGSYLPAFDLMVGCCCAAIVGVVWIHRSARASQSAPARVAET
ncbi:MAG: MFS transporter [Pseudomonadota bacterium]